MCVLVNATREENADIPLLGNLGYSISLVVRSAT